MRETEYTGWLVKQLRKRLPQAVVFKHTDLYTIGVPDISITLNSRITLWVECKVVGGRLRKIQARNIERLDGLIVTFDGSNQEAVLNQILQEVGCL